MERWLLTFFIGALCALILPIAPSPYYVTLFTAVAMLFLLIKGMKLYSGFFFAMAWLLFHGASYNNIWQANAIDSGEFFEKTRQVTGKVVSISHDGDDESSLSPQRFNFLVESVEQEPLKKPLLIRLNWLAKSHFTDSAKLSDTNKLKTVKQGQRWQLTVKLKPGAWPSEYWGL